MSSDAGAARWLSVHDDLLRGLAHAFSNRVATVAAIAALFDSSRIPDERMLTGLRTDADRLDGLLEQLRQLTRREDADLEPLMPGDSVRAALALFEHHPEYREVRCTVVVADDVQPVRADPASLQHALCVALVAAARVGVGQNGATRADVRVALSTEGDAVRIEVSTDGSTGEGDVDALSLDAGAISWLLARSNGRGHAYPYGCLIELPTLQASRRAR
ncbi:HAMP domain-containing histidine kinase [Gemmatimonas groenlandica]|uniref:HAMP domain-containing histidine kinase n=1 Tax=Gemmatimonas groenlandica TaxID=2732249 RepID=A0A6M4IP27_9BACT|nr:HAMP domain-containing histidine kinase [Gemmatimonas groenlandica]QJR36483.1 HAMP domain-containing histidine kinase [Gemmatimonas groenlandica]